MFVYQSHLEKFETYLQKLQFSQKNDILNLWEILTINMREAIPPRIVGKDKQFQVRK